MEKLDKIPDLPEDGRVRGLIYDAFATIADPPAYMLSAFRLGQYPFVALSKIATLSRFPAGQIAWELSGIPRSFFLRARRRDLFALVRCVVSCPGGLRPLFMPHFSVFRGNLLVLLEREVNRSLHRIAKAMELQPQVRGFVATAWFYAPATYRVSPHLPCLRSTIVDNGGFATTRGDVKSGDAALTLSIRRRQGYESDAFKPREGLVIWPRADMLRWAHAHPELE